MHYFKGTISTHQYSLNWNTFQFLLNIGKIHMYTYAYVCINVQILLLFLNKLPQIFPRSTQKLKLIQNYQRSSFNSVKRCTRIFSAFWTIDLVIDIKNSNIRLSDIPLKIRNSYIVKQISKFFNQPVKT